MGGGADITKLGLGVDSSYQNLAEFAGAFLSLVCIVKLGLLREVQNSGFGLRGDSISSLTWMVKELFRVSNASDASIVLGSVCRSQVSASLGT